MRRLYRIRGALERLSKGIYGVCLQCNRAIPDERLLALPDVELCIACQEKLEGKEKRGPLSKSSRRRSL
jgi:DnaK suppressor protein